VTGVDARIVERPEVAAAGRLETGLQKAKPAMEAAQ
jgi:hypothetical protein